MSKPSRGFTLLELMVAGGCAALVAVAAFAAVTAMQRATATQIEASEVVSGGRLGMELMLQDVRLAGDSVNLLGAPCIPAGSSHPGASTGCPAILEAHPWRIILARNAWTPGASGSPSGMDAQPPAEGALITAGASNIVAYEFVPALPAGAAIIGANGAAFSIADPTNVPTRINRNTIFGRIDRITNPYGYAGQAAQRVTLVENVILDDAMRCDPTNATNCDHRLDFALFTFRMAARPGELQGDGTLVGVGRTTTSGVFLTPPMSFYQMGGIGDAPLQNGGNPAGAGWTPTPQLVPGNPGAPSVVGLNAGPAASAALFVPGYDDAVSTSTASMDPLQFNSYMRLVLDRGRIRAVRISFKVYSDREDPTYPLGLELRAGPGTAPVFEFDSTAETKALSWRTRPTDI